MNLHNNVFLWMNFQNCNEKPEILLESLLFFVDSCSITALLLYYRAQTITWQYFLMVVVLLLKLTFPARRLFKPYLISR